MSKKKHSREKIGRNDSCPCGSGKKYKKCHAEAAATQHKRLTEDVIKRKFDELQALQKQRQQQQGFGNPIISALHEGFRFVLVGNTALYSQNWQTFHDFLAEYLKQVFGYEWGQVELRKPPEKRHPIFQWLSVYGEYQRALVSSQPRRVYSAPMTGAVAAYLRLAYDLYVLAHNERIQEILIRRLKDPNQFFGALYETSVASFFIQAGFQLSFENESDGAHTHCEFTAVFKETGARFSVEAKARASGKTNLDVGNQLYAALKKEADHPRVVFIELNLPDPNSEPAQLDWRPAVVESLRGREEKLTVDGLPAPPAYIFVTNNPSQYSLRSSDYRTSFTAEGFKIPEFKQDSRFFHSAGGISRAGQPSGNV